MRIFFAPLSETNIADEMPDGEEARHAAARFPAISLSAEYLVIGHLLRRNVLTYKAPPMNEGYDLICIHPDPRRASRQLRVRVKSRYATDCDRGFPVKERSIDAFDFLVVAFLNVAITSRRRRSTRRSTVRRNRSSTC